MMIDKKYFYFKLDQWHHLYTGIILLAVSIYHFDEWWSILLMCFSVWLIIDDIGQHVMQATVDKRYHSFGHYIGRPFYHLRRWLAEKTGWKWLYKF